MANMTVTASLSDTISSTSFDENDYQRKPVSVRSGLFNSADLRNLTIASSWPYDMSEPQSQLLSPPRPATGGLTAIFAAPYNFNMTAMINDETLLYEASRIQQRFFGEVL
jgi:hypothetical protein